MRQTLREFCDERQQEILDEIHDRIMFFSKLNSNTVTAALEAFLRELTRTDFVSPDYLQEKLNLIAQALRGS